MLTNLSLKTNLQRYSLASENLVVNKNNLNVFPGRVEDLKRSVTLRFEILIFINENAYLKLPSLGPKTIMYLIYVI